MLLAKACRWRDSRRFGLVASLIVVAIVLGGCGSEEETQTMKGPGKEPFIAHHEYDPISDAVISWELKPGQRAGQSFSVERQGTGLAGFRVKLMRVGEVGPILYRLGSSWGGDDVLSGTIDPEEVSRFFESWCGVDLVEKVSLEPGEYFLQFEAEAGDWSGRYEIFGTTQAALEHPQLRSHYQYLPAWGDQPEQRNPENPMNIDLGATTPTYAGGIALESNDTDLQAIDFAFQLTTEAGSADSDNEERFEFVQEELLEHVHVQSSLRSDQPPSSEEQEIGSNWTFIYPASEEQIIETAVSDFQEFMSVEMSVDLTARAGIPSEPDSGPALTLGTKEELADCGSDLQSSESFELRVDSEEVVLCGFDDRGVMRGLHYLEDLMKLRGAPILEKGIQNRSPIQSPRITTAPFYAQAALDYPDTPYTDEFLSRISHYGFNGIWIWGDLFDVGRSDVFPELDEGVETRQARLREISDRAHKYGIDVILVLAYRPLPSEFFEDHPGVRGSPFKAYGGDYVLCTSTDLVRNYIHEATANLFAEVPRLKGVAFIIGGEGFIHCYTRKMDCPRCSSRTAASVVAEISETVKDGARSVKPDADAAMWAYSASNWWSKGDETQSKVLSQLSDEVTLLTTFGKEGLITFGDTTIPAYDYPISYLGPSERFVEQARITKSRGIPLWVKTEHAIALEFIQTPYIPVFTRWAERFRRIAEFDWASGLFANWMHYGFMPSVAADVTKWHTWKPLPDQTEILTKIARRDFGPGVEEDVLAAWEKWSEAISHYPFSGRMALGPIQKGPAHPLLWDPDYEPRHHYGRQFKNDLSWTEPWGPDLALDQLEKMENGWVEGMVSWNRVEENAGPLYRASATRMGNVSRALLACIRSTLHLGRFIQLRDQLVGETDDERITEILDALEEIAQAELENAKSALPAVAGDSRIGYVNSGKGETIGAARGGLYSPISVQKKIKQVERLLEEQIPEYRRQRSF